MQGTISNKNVFFSTYFAPEDIPIYEGTAPEQTCQEFIWAVFRTYDDQRFRLLIQSSSIRDCNKRIELCRIPGVVVEYHEGAGEEAHVDIIGAEFNRSFKTFEDLKTWRGQKRHDFVKGPINVRLVDGQEVRLRVLSFCREGQWYAALSFAPLD